MSGSGQSGSGAPSHLTPIAMDQPIGMSEDGKAVLPTYWFGQMITRILAYLGQPVSGSGSSGGSNLTIGEQIAALQTSIDILESAGSTVAGLASRVAELEALAGRLRALIGSPADEEILARVKSIATWGM